MSKDNSQLNCKRKAKTVMVSDKSDHRRNRDARTLATQTTTKKSGGGERRIETIAYHSPTHAM